MKELEPKGETFRGKAKDHATPVYAGKRVVEQTHKHGGKYLKRVRIGHLFDYEFVKRLNQRQKRKRRRQVGSY